MVHFHCHWAIFFQFVGKFDNSIFLRVLLMSPTVDSRLFWMKKWPFANFLRLSLLSAFLECATRSDSFFRFSATFFTFPVPIVSGANSCLCKCICHFGPFVVLWQECQFNNVCILPRNRAFLAHLYCTTGKRPQLRLAKLCVDTSQPVLCYRLSLFNILSVAQIPDTSSFVKTCPLFPRMLLSTHLYPFEACATVRGDARRYGFWTDLTLWLLW